VEGLDWAKTPLGPTSEWPQSLRTAVHILLTSRYAMWMAWGEKLTMLYNDAYRPTLGIKHPWALGTPASQVWAEIWRDIGPRIETVLSSGSSTYDEGLLLFLERSGFPEETYHTFSYSPLTNDSGQVSGMLCVVTEETERIISERRLATLRELASALASSNTEHEVFSAVESQLGANTKDLPFTLTYLFDADGNARLVCATGIEEEHPAAASQIERNANTPWPASDIFETPVARLVSELFTLYPSVPLPTGAWDKPPQEVAVVPIKQHAHEHPAGFLVAGINPYLRYDTAYAGFVDLVAGQIAAGIANARAYEGERRRARALAELDQAKTQFFSNVSHEFRTPLTLMLSPLEDTISTSGELPSGIAESLTVVHRNGLRLLRLVNSLLDFSRIEAGRVRAMYEPTDLAHLTAELASSFRSATDRAGLELIVDCPRLSEPVYVDREMWEKVVLNLLSNAFKFTFEGGITVRIRESNNGVEIQVIDTGTGIPEHELPHLFERFHRVEGARGRTFEGSGIGLALVQELVRLHGGTVRVESTVGQGSTFTVSLPFGTAHLPDDQIGGERTNVSTAVRAEAFVEEALRWLAGGGSRAQNPGEDNLRLTTNVMASAEVPLAERSGRVLVADDNADLRDYVERLLTAEYEVVTATNGEEALRLALDRQPDLVLSDIMMPGMNGFALLKALRSHPQTKTIPVILLSARAGEEARTEGMDSGADDYLVKPFSARELRARVGAHLKLARARQEAEETARTTLESITDAFVSLDRDWRFTYVNGEAERLNGMRREDMLGKNHWGLYPAAVGTTIYEELHRARAEHVVVEFDNFYEPWNRWFHVKAYPARDGGLSVFYEDITERRCAEQALRESEARFHVMADSAPALIWMSDTTKECIWFNRPWLEFTGRTMEQEVGSGWAEGVHPSDLQRCIEIYGSAFDSRESFQMDYRLRRHDGEYRWILDHGIPRFGPDGTFTGYIGSCIDITDRKQQAEMLKRSNEELIRANRELEEFAYVASHDLQEPLRMVNIYTQLLLKNLHTESHDTQRYADFVRQGVTRMEALIRDLLSYSRAIHPDGPASGEAQLSESLAQALLSLKARIDETGASITFDPLPVAWGDTTQFVHVFQNLLSNSLKYRKLEVSPEIHISVRRDSSYWVISLQDNGIGFHQRYAERIFGLFKRLHKDEYPGTGLGLAICQRIVERHGGRMWAEGRPGDGATLHFTVRSRDAR